MRVPYLKWIVIAVVLLGAALGYYLLHGEEEAAPSLPVVEELGPKHEVIGRSVEGRSIDAYTYGSGDTELLFVGGVHGGYEWNSVLLAYTFMDYFDSNPDVIPAGFAVTVIPSANPDGLYKIVGKEGRFERTDVPDSADQSLGRFNANGVDLNRNFDCKWQPESTWRSQTVSAGTAPFSEPESKAIRDYVLKAQPDAAIFWHSQASAVYASECENGVIPETVAIMNTYANAAGYNAVESFDSYTVTGDVEGWLASIGIPAITVELRTHETIEWEGNRDAVKAVFGHFLGK